VPLDFVLVVHVLVNLIDNASSIASRLPIQIRTRPLHGEITIEVADQGVGIPAEDLDRVFQKFYRVQRPDNVTGTGLAYRSARVWSRPTAAGFGPESPGWRRRHHRRPAVV